MITELTFVTSNGHKLSDAREILGDGVVVRQVAMDLEEIQAVELEKVARHKLQQAYAKLGRPLFCEDTGLFIEALNGFPGALIKLYLDRIGVEGISRLHGGSAAYAKTVAGYHDGSAMHFFSGLIRGRVARTPQGEGFGWTTVFVPCIDGEAHGKSFAELSFARRNKVSMRGQALGKMLAHLRSRG